MEITMIITYSLLFVTLYAQVFLVLAFFDSYTETAADDHTVLPAQVPTVAIIVPCFNEEKTVSGTIASLLAMHYPKDKLEVIVVDDGSKDRTFAIASEYVTGDKADSRVRVFSKPNGGKHSAMNYALQHTDAEIIGCLDADSFVTPESLTASIAQLHSTGAVAVTPAIVVYKPHNILQYIQQAEYSLGIFIRRAFSAAGAIFITPGPFSLFNRSVILAVGGWKHAHGTEDLEMGLRLQANHYKITNTPYARALTTAPDTIYKLYKQRVRWTYGFIMNALDYRYMFFNPQFGGLGMVLLPAAFFSIFIVFYFIGNIVFNLMHTLYSLWLQVSILGISWSMPSFFYFNTSTIALIAYTLIVLAITLVLIGKRLSGVKMISFDLPLYLLCYSFLAPLWLFGAVTRATLRVQAPWR
jgi:cellulose synthase/poly-beta-1,6-N-acetylglucosamine synthase-like glycosyltransferase